MNDPLENVPQTGPGGDALINEVRAIRRQISEQFGNDVDRLIDHLQTIERAHPGKVIQPEDVAARSLSTRRGSE
jgi:hypothetical protein